MFKKQSIIPAVLWGFFILYLTLKPKSGDDSHFPAWLSLLHPDKIAHFGFWGLWYIVYHATYLKYISNAGDSTIKRNKQVIFVAVAIVVGGMIELLQLKSNWGRSAEWLDLFADSSGVFTAFLFYRLRDKV
jgi:hypothetical protein